MAFTKAAFYNNILPLLSGRRSPQCPAGTQQSHLHRMLPVFLGTGCRQNILLARQYLTSGALTKITFQYFPRIWPVGVVMVYAKCDFIPCRHSHESIPAVSEEVACALEYASDLRSQGQRNPTRLLSSIYNISVSCRCTSKTLMGDTALTQVRE